MKKKMIELCPNDLQSKENFVNYLIKLKNEDKIDWTKKIINTQKPVLAIPTPQLKAIVKQIEKTGIYSFLDMQINDYYENSIINGLLISNIQDFDKMKQYLDVYVTKIDNWAECDVLSFSVKNREERFYNLSFEYIKSENVFTRRVGIIILFNFINDQYIKKIFSIIKELKEVEDYYVNMASAWLVCECFIKQREKTLKFLEKGQLNKFTMNKAISKCRDSKRVSLADKEMLLEFKQ